MSIRSITSADEQIKLSAAKHAQNQSINLFRWRSLLLPPFSIHPPIHTEAIRTEIPTTAINPTHRTFCRLAQHASLLQWSHSISATLSRSSLCLAGRHNYCRHERARPDTNRHTSQCTATTSCLAMQQSVRECVLASVHRPQTLPNWHVKTYSTCSCSKSSSLSSSTLLSWHRVDMQASWRLMLCGTSGRWLTFCAAGWLAEQLWLPLTAEKDHVWVFVRMTMQKHTEPNRTGNHCCLNDCIEIISPLVAFAHMHKYTYTMWLYLCVRFRVQKTTSGS